MSIGRTTWEKKKNTHLFVKKCEVFISMFASRNSWKKPKRIISGHCKDSIFRSGGYCC